MHPLRADIGIGSNLDDPLAQVRAALQALAALPASQLSTCSPLYRSVPVGGPPGQPDYLNAVAALDTRLSADQLLRALQAIEAAQGRVRELRWGPRTLDLDLLLYADLVRDDAWLTLPHPRLHLRAFVLYPLADLAPDLALPGRGSLTAWLPAVANQGIVRLEN